MTKPLTRIPVRVTVLTPLHIGSGSELLLDYDIIPRGGRTYRVDEDALLAYVLEGGAGTARADRALQGRPPRELVSAADYERAELFRYIIPGTPFTKTAGSKVREQLKDAYDRVYLPGSSLKGALRTVLLWAYYAERGRRPDLTLIPVGDGRRPPDPRRAAEQLERERFVPNPAERRGNAPNYDWMRALHVADSNALPVPDPNAPPAERYLQLRTALVYPTETAQSPSGLRIDVEAVVGATFDTEFVIEEYPFDDPDASEKLEWTKDRERRRLIEIAATGRRYAAHRLQDEMAFFRGRPDVTQVVQVIRLLQQRLDSLQRLSDQNKAHGFLLQVGWGTGWEDKTLGIDLLRQHNAEFEGLLEDYRMLKPGTKRQAGDPFPKTRAVVLRGEAKEAPPGWVEVRLGEVDGHA